MRQAKLREKVHALKKEKIRRAMSSRERQWIVTARGGQGPTLSAGPRSAYMCGVRAGRICLLMQLGIPKVD